MSYNYRTVDCVAKSLTIMTQNVSPAVPIAVKEDPNIYVAKSFQISMINWWAVIRTLYLPRLFSVLVLILVAGITNSLVDMNVSFQDVMDYVRTASSAMVALGWQGVVLLGAIFCYALRLRSPVYLVDYSLFSPPESWRVSHEDIANILRHQKVYDEDSVEFMEKILARSGTGQATHWPPQYTKVLSGEGASEDTVEHARSEFEQVVFPAVEEVLQKTGLDPKSVDFLIVNCSLFSPTPSLCAMVALRFKMRSDIRSYNLSGMGCSASVISVDLAKELLASNPNTTALVISTENLTRALYKGQKRSMLLQNTLFRCGAAALVLSNKYSDAHRAKYKLLHTVRTQRITEEAYQCVFECQDEEKNQGIRLSKDIVKVAGKALTANLTSMGPLILPIREQMKVVYSIVLYRYAPKLRAMLKGANMSGLADLVPIRTKSYVPDFTRCVDYFCVHAGGRAVIDGIEQNLKLQPHHMEASRTTLRDFGNTSSSSIWYELRALENAGGMKRGSRVLQIAFGSGFKCNSSVWLSLKKSQ